MNDARDILQSLWFSEDDDRLLIRLDDTVRDVLSYVEDLEASPRVLLTGGHVAHDLRQIVTRGLEGGGE